MNSNTILRFFKFYLRVLEFFNLTNYYTFYEIILIIFYKRS